MEQSLSWEPNCFLASQEIPRLVWNPKVHYCIYKHPPPIRTLSQITAVPVSLTHFLKIHLILPYHPCLGIPGGLFPSGFPTKTLHAHLLFPIRATCHAHLILLGLIARIIFGEEYRSLSSSLKVNKPYTTEVQCTKNYKGFWRRFITTGWIPGISTFDMQIDHEIWPS